MPEAVAALEPCAKTTSAEPPTATAIAIESARRDAASFLMVETPLYRTPRKLWLTFLSPSECECELFAFSAQSRANATHSQQHIARKRPLPGYESSHGRCYDRTHSGRRPISWGNDANASDGALGGFVRGGRSRLIHELGANRGGC